MAGRPPARLYVILAREAPRAAIIRRGPTKWTEIVEWNTASDEFTKGHWFHGRIYERRCDLSPDGNRLVYFAAKFSDPKWPREFGDTWTAVSNLPWLTAIGIWEKGDCWAGGGLFDDNDTLSLNQVITGRYRQPDQLNVIQNEQAHGEDNPIWSKRMERDGWKYVQAREVKFDGLFRGFITK